MKVRGSLDYSEHKMVEYRTTTRTSGFLQLYKLQKEQKKNQGKCTPDAEWGRRPDEKGMENAKVLGAHFTSLFTVETCHQELQSPEIRRKVWNMKDLPFLGEDQLREFKVNMHKSMEPDPQVLRVLANAIVRPLSVIFERSGQNGVFMWAGKK